jgi:hypothetical protein
MNVQALQRGGQGQERLRRHEPQAGSAQKVATLRDVAAAAGVSIATASSVMNHPEAVAHHTRERVTNAITELGYRRNEAAASLRANVRRAPEATKTPAAKKSAPPTSAKAERRPRSRTRLPNEPETLPPFQALASGTTVELVRGGSCIGRGVIDDMMSDGSAFWAWMDGAGRQLIHRSDGVSVLELRRPVHAVQLR